MTISAQKLTDYFEFLDDLRKSGVTNMYGASPYLENAFGLNRDRAITVLSSWMVSFSDKPMSERVAAALEAERAS